MDAAGDEYNGGDKAGVLRNAPIIKGGLDIMQVRWEYLTPPEFKKLVKEEQICILPLSKFGLMQITRQRVRPAMDVNTTEICPTCFGKGTIKSSILFTDTLESKIDYLVNKLKVKKFSLHVHPYVAAFINQGLVSLRRKWQMKYGFGIKIIPSQKLAFLQYVFYDTHGEEIDMKEEIEIK